MHVSFIIIKTKCCHKTEIPAQKSLLLNNTPFSQFWVKLYVNNLKLINYRNITCHRQYAYITITKNQMVARGGR